MSGGGGGGGDPKTMTVAAADGKETTDERAPKKRRRRRRDKKSGCDGGDGSGGIVGWLCSDPTVRSAAEYGQTTLASARWWLRVLLVAIACVVALQFVLTGALLFYVRRAVTTMHSGGSAAARSMGRAGA